VDWRLASDNQEIHMKAKKTLTLKTQIKAGESTGMQRLPTLHYAAIEYSAGK
jgi:hypothetical protein